MCPCSDCANTREGPAWSLFNPTCLWCGARLIGRIRSLPRPPAEIKARQLKVLEDWVAFGHSKEDLLRLSRTKCPVAPLECESQTQEKPRSAAKKSASGSASA